MLFDSGQFVSVEYVQENIISIAIQKLIRCGACSREWYLRVDFSALAFKFGLKRERERMLFVKKKNNNNKTETIEKKNRIFELPGG